MSISPRAGPSHPPSHTTGFITENGQENVPLLSEELSSQKATQYTSGKQIPNRPTPSHATNTDAIHGIGNIAVDEDPVDHVATTETPKSSTGLANQQERRGRLAVLYYKYNPQMILENRGSTARDHLASERTFLTYVRTSLALASTGVALVQLLTSSAAKTGGEASKRVQKFAQPLGVLTVVMALITLGIAIYRYFLIQVALPRDMFPVARFSVIFITFSLSAVVVVIFTILAGR